MKAKAPAHAAKASKHEHFISKETLEQIADLVEPLSDYFGMPMTLFDADGNVFCQSMRPSLCSSIAGIGGLEGATCQSCYQQLRNRLRDVYDSPVIAECSAGVRVVALPIKTEMQFIGMLCLDFPADAQWDQVCARAQATAYASTQFPAAEVDAGAQAAEVGPPNMFEQAVRDQQRGQALERKLHSPGDMQLALRSMIALLDSLLRQIAKRNQDLGELVSQLLEFQDELTLSYRFSSVAARAQAGASGNMDINSLFREALELIQGHIRPREAYIVIPSESESSSGEIVYSLGDAILETELEMGAEVLKGDGREAAPPFAKGGLGGIRGFETSERTPMTSDGRDEESFTRYSSLVTSKSEAPSESSDTVIRKRKLHEVIQKALLGTPVVVNSYESASSRGYAEAKADDEMYPSDSFRTRSILAMPIRTGKDVFGAIVLVDRANGEMFLADDENFVASLTNSLGMVLKHVRLAQEVINAEKASVEKQKEIIARVVHKMRNLFVAMKGNVKWVKEILAAEEPDSGDLESALAGIDRNFQASSKIISGFLKYVAPEQFQPEYADVSSLITEIVEEMRKALDGDIQIEEDYARGLPKIKIDVELFRSIIEELIVNAFQNLKGMSYKGCIRLRTDFASEEELAITSAGVELGDGRPASAGAQAAEAPGAQAKPSFIVVEVSDNGPGIPDDIKSRIFNLGFSTRSMGTGLGLSLVKRDIERNRGKIVEIGKQGAHFLIVLPTEDWRLEATD